MSTRRRRGPRRPAHTTRLALLSLAGTVPALLVAAGALLAGGSEPMVAASLVGLAAAAAMLAALAVARRAGWPLRTLANLLGGLREGDFSLRVRGGGGDDPLAELTTEANALAAALRAQRLGALEATSLLRAVIAEIDVAILVFDPAGRLRLANRSAERLLARPVERLLGLDAGELDLADCLLGEPARTLERAFPGGSGRFGVRRTTVREGGVPHHLLVIANLSTTLREEERSAWQRLIRVLGHELNNSLAPIKSIAGSLRRRLGRPSPGAADDPERQDLAQGLAVIEERADALARFLEGYSRLARLPLPRRQPVVIADLVAATASLEKRVPVRIDGGPPCVLAGDPDQLQQLLINLLANAAEAIATGGETTDSDVAADAAADTSSPQQGIAIGWRLGDGALELTVTDDGPGLANPANLFVPFFTTKRGGSGIGLVLCREIAEGHEGSLRLEPRADGCSGCVARLRLPLG